MKCNEVYECLRLYISRCRIPEPRGIRPALVGTAPLAVARRRPVNTGRRQTPGTGSTRLEGRGRARGGVGSWEGRMDSGVRERLGIAGAADFTRFAPRAHDTRTSPVAVSLSACLPCRSPPASDSRRASNTAAPQLSSSGANHSTLHVIHPRQPPSAWGEVVTVRLVLLWQKDKSVLYIAWRGGLGYQEERPRRRC